VESPRASKPRISALTFTPDIVHFVTHANRSEVLFLHAGMLNNLYELRDLAHLKKCHLTKRFHCHSISGRGKMAERLRCL